MKKLLKTYIDTKPLEAVMYSRKKIPDHFLLKPDLPLPLPQRETLALEAAEKTSRAPRFPAEVLLLLHFFSKKKKIH